MKTNKLWMLTTILTCGFLLMSCLTGDNDDTPSGGDDKPAAGTADVAILYYGIGGGDLDDEAEKDFMSAAVSMYYKAKNVRYFVQYKYSGQEGYEENLKKKKKAWPLYNYVMSGDFGCVYRYELSWPMFDEHCVNENNELVDLETLGTKAFRDLSPYKVGDAAYQMYEPSNLSGYVRWALQQAPEVKAVVLCLGDHGGAYSPIHDYDKSKAQTRGVMYDDNLEDKPCMSAQEIASALNLLSADERAKINIINFDCCLMNNLEVLGELKDLVPYVMASSHSVPSADHGELVERMGESKGELKAMADNAKVYISHLLEKQRKLFFTYNKQMDVYRNLDYTVTDMSKLDALFASLKAVVDYLTSEANAPTLTAMSSQYEMAASQCYQFVNTFPYYDVMDYLNKLRDNVFPGDSQFAELVSNVKAAVKAAQYGHVDYTYSLDTENGTNDLGLSYSVMLGCNAGVFSFEGNAATADPNQGAIMMSVNAKGENDAPYNYIVMENGDCYYHYMQKGEEVSYKVIDQQSGDGAPYKSWANTYQTTVFDKVTGWSQWMRINPGLPYGNPPKGDDGDNAEWLIDFEL